MNLWQFLQPLIVERQKVGYIDKNISVDQVMVFYQPAVNSPIILSAALGNGGAKGGYFFNEYKKRKKP